MSCLVDRSTELLICSDICRLCVQKEDILWNIFEVCDGEGVSLKLAEKMVTLLDIVVEMNDGLPDQVCAKCMTAVRCFFEFRQQCKEHDSMLRNSLVTHDKHNSTSLTSGHKHLERERECQAENHYETALQRPEEHYDTRPEEQTSPPRSNEASGQLLDNNINNSVAEQLQEDWNLDDDCEVVGSLTDLRKSELPWRLGAEISCEKKLLEINCAETKNHPDSFPKNEIVHPARLLRVNFSTHGSGSIASKHTENKNLHDNNKNSSNVMVPTVVDLEPNLVSAHTDQGDLAGAVEQECAEPSNEMFAGKISFNQQGLWVCNICNQEYLRLLDLKLHIERHYSNCKNRCPECEMLFESPEELSCHKTQHATSSLVLGHACDQCYKTFRQKHLLVKHVALEHTSDETRKNVPKKFRVACGKCVRVFYSSVEMEDHDESCTEGMNECEEDSPESAEESETSTKASTAPRKKGSNRHECYLCRLDFDSFRQLKFHFAKVHKGDKPMKCNMLGCEKVFRTPSNLYDHKRTVHARQFSCDHCEKAFVDKMRLLTHIRQHHLNQKPFKCKTCNKAFASAQNLRWHKHTHTKSFKCDTCGAQFGSNYNLSRHKTSHASEKRYVCEDCGDCFSHSSNLSKHKSKGLNINLVCTECGLKFCTEYRLRAHKHQHAKETELICELCGVQYAHKSSLHKHMRNRHSSYTEAAPSHEGKLHS